MSILYRSFLTIIALSLAIAVFLIKNKYYLFSDINLRWITIHSEWSFLIYVAVCIFLARLSLILAEKLSDDAIAAGTVKSLEQASDGFLPSYLGYFFVSLSIESVKVFIAVFLLLAVFIYFSRSVYYNPLYYFFRFKFYFVTTEKNAKILIISRKDLKLPENVSFEKIKRIDDFTYIDIQGAQE